MDFIDEEDIALFKIGQQRREIAGLGDNGAGRGAEIDPQFLGHDLRQRRLAKTGRTDEQHVVERLTGLLRSLDEHLHVRTRRTLTDELRQAQRADRLVHVVGALLRRQERVGRRLRLAHEPCFVDRAARPAMGGHAGRLGTGASGFVLPYP